MRRMTAKYFFFVAVVAELTFFAGNGSANKLDLTVGRFIECTPDGVDCIAHNGAYEQFMAEYAFGVSPKLLASSSTLGYSGFYLGIESSIAGVPSDGTSRFNATARNYEDARWRVGTADGAAGSPPAMFFPTVHVRKGLPWSMELGSSISYLAQSELVALGGEVKWSLFEGYRKGFLGVMPDLAVRGTVNRIIGETDVDMTLVGADAAISYPIGIGGMISIEPYAGYQFMWTIIRTEPIALYDSSTDPPTLVQSTANHFDASEANMTGPNLTRNNVFGGIVFRYELLTVTMDWTVGLPGSWTTKQYMVPGDAAMQNVDVKVGTQLKYSFGVGLQF
ncbi:MAG: hypothetical protein JXX29_22145 [Deltaproteobacteria bacterium]|nr:hypothetical protein [Deltaproteobacteria bacterium]MBN2674398.1 hypothetical protein [Deltaproteobacteria bacterium]